MPSDQQQPPNGPTNLPSIKTGYTIVALSAFFFLIIGYMTFFSAFIPSPPNFVREPMTLYLAAGHLTVGKVLKVVVEDTHYKYLALFLIPTFSYFAIANWVGWQYYQNS